MIYRIFPGSNLETICGKYHEKGDLVTKRLVDAGIAVLAGESETQLNPPSSVRKDTEQAWLVYFKVAFLTEPEVIALCDGVLPSALGMTNLTLTSLRLPDGNISAGYLVSLQGLPADLKETCLKVKVFRKQGLMLQNHYLLPDQQLVQEQSLNTWTFLTTSESLGELRIFCFPYSCLSAHGLMKKTCIFLW